MHLHCMKCSRFVAPNSVKLHCPSPCFLHSGRLEVPDVPTGYALIMLMCVRSGSRVSLSRSIELVDQTS